MSEEKIEEIIKQEHSPGSVMKSSMDIGNEIVSTIEMTEDMKVIAVKKISNELRYTSYGFTGDTLAPIYLTDADINPSANFGGDILRAITNIGDDA